VLADEGESLATLAQKFACSKSLVRDFIMLASLPEDLEKPYMQGKLGRKKVLALARDRKKPVEATQVLGSRVQLQSLQGTRPVMDKSARRGEIAKYATLVVDWVHSTNLAPCNWEPFFRQVILVLYGPFRWLLSENAPRSNEIRPGQDPVKVIKRCKPHFGSAVSMPDVINMHLDWLARWIQIVVPDRELMKEALGRAEAALVREAWAVPR
jgi:hypothetical protein